MPLLTVIITTYQAERTVERAVSSVLENGGGHEVEIIVVDDHSTDQTCDRVRAMQKRHPDIRLYIMEENTGTPSEPRNKGISLATGKYVTFLDDDDEIVMPNLLRMVCEAEEKDADFVKGYLFCEEKGIRYEANRLSFIPKGKGETIRCLIQYQSMTQDFIVRRSLLMEHAICYPKGVKIGEDTVFILSVLKSAVRPAYLDNWFLIYHKTASYGDAPAATQHWGDQEVQNQILAWQSAQKICQEMIINYYSLRLPAALRNLLLMLVRYSDGISEKTYHLLSSFARDTKPYTCNKMNLLKRYQELYAAILSGNYDTFRKTMRRRLLIAGYDLKFILPVIPYLENEYEVRVDEWSGHNAHDKKQSQECAEWADIIWCEWLLGNAVYYSRIKNSNQWLVIRAHRFEITREFGLQVDYNKVDAFFAVGYYYFEKFLSHFAVPAKKARLLSNYVEEKQYDMEKGENYQYHIGLIGAIPERKGLHKALELINGLVRKDRRFRLYIMGKRPEELDWIRNNPSEAAYYQKCDDYIRKQGISEHIVWGGFVEQEKLYREIGFVLSLSDSEVPESFHLALAEGACAGCVGLTLPWPGVEFIYPHGMICKDEADMASRIFELSGSSAAFQKQSAEWRRYVIERYGMDAFVKVLKRYLRQIRM